MNRSRLRLPILLALVAILALASFWGLQVMRKNDDSASSSSQHQEPDYYVENFNYLRLSTTGEARYNIAGQRMTHHPTDDSLRIEQPVVHSLSSEHAPLTGTAQRAIVDNQHNKIHLYDDVHIDRPATPDDEHFHLSSEYLLVLTDEDIMQTDQPALITLGASRLQGDDLFVNNATREMFLSGRVHATYQPSPPASARPPDE